MVDNAFHLQHTLRKLQSLKHATSDSMPKIVAIMNSTEYEIYRRKSIHLGETDYLHFCSMPVFQTSDAEMIVTDRFIATFSTDKSLDEINIINTDQR